MSDVANLRKLITAHGAFLLILAGSAALRLLLFDYPVGNGEVQRDYLVARHIVRYQEYPLTGPCCLWNGAFGHIRNSPAYYYLLAAFLLVRDDVLWLQAVNGLLQLGLIAMIYLASYVLFGRVSAVAAALLFGVSEAAIRHAQFIWQPHVMHPILWVSLVTLLCASRQRSRVWLAVSVFTYLLSAAVHNAAYGLLPAYGLAVLVVVRSFPERRKAVILTGTTVLLSWFLLYGSWMYVVLRQPEAMYFLKGAARSAWNLSPISLWGNVRQAILLLVTSGGKGVALPVFIAVGLIWFLVGHKRMERSARVWLWILIGVTVQFLVVASLFRAPLAAHYLTPIVGLWTIVVAVIFASVLPQSRRGRAVIAGTFFILVAFGSGIHMAIGPLPLENARLVGGLTATLADKLRTLKAVEKRSSFDFFVLRVYATDVESPVTSNLVFWAPLEKAIGEKLFTVVDREHSYVVGSREDYVVVVCQSYRRPIAIQEECLKPFSREHPRHALVEKVWDEGPFLVFLAKRALSPHALSF